MKNTLIISLSVAILIVGLGAVRISGMTRLMGYENTVLEQLKNEPDIEIKSLDLVEQYIQENQFSLGIEEYARNEHSINVRFITGISHVFLPASQVYLGVD
ncbi:MAG: hypothetical protein IJ708_12360 [Clostridia bacterium]|nr:hypothetical protein [Clostridia bacterium]